MSPELADEQRFAAARGATQQRRAATVLGCIAQLEYGPLMAFPGVIPASVRAILERTAVKLPVGFVHAAARPAVVALGRERLGNAQQVLVRCGDFQARRGQSAGFTAADVVREDDSLHSACRLHKPIYRRAAHWTGINKNQVIMV